MYLNDWAVRMWELWAVAQAVMIAAAAVAVSAGIYWVANRMLIKGEGETEEEWGEPVD